MKLVYSKNALSDLEELPSQISLRILQKLSDYANGRQSDIKKLKGRNDYRLRVGSYRIFFEKDGDTAHILGITERKNAY